MTEEPTLRILLLGASAFYSGETPLHIQRRLLRWLLAYLGTQKDKVGRSDLILLFWPDEAEEDARRHLRETLSKLRAQLPDPDLIVTEQDRVGLNFNRVYSDVLEFQQLYAQTSRICEQTPASVPLTQAVRQQVRSAIRLWRSGRFMAGAALPGSEGLSNWLLFTSQQLETQRQRLLERLVDHDIASGDVDSAINGLRLVLEGDETNESLQFRLLSLLHQQNRYSEALNYCSHLQELFRREGYSELPPALLSLSRKIRERASQPAPDREQPAWPTLADMQVPFVGRQGVMRELQLAHRRGGPVIVFGETGAGKSRLVRELFFSLKPAPRLLLAPARVMENDLSFQPIIDLLRHDIRAEEWLQMDPTWVSPLSLLLPELAIMRPEIRPPAVAPNQEHRFIFEALHRLFLFIAHKQRFLLFLDNAQWSDTATLSALAYLAERGLFGENGSLVLAARSEESTRQLESFLNRPRSAFSVQRLSITPLDQEEVGVLAHYILGDTFTPSIVPRLERETGGNPLFILETLRLLLDYSFDPQIAPAMEHLPLAGPVHTLIRERLQQLAPYDAQVLSMAAIIGNEFSVDLLESTCMLPPEQVVKSLESLAQLNLIKAAMQDRLSGGYFFVHEKFREVILMDLSPARKRLLHLRTARALEKKHEGQSAEMEGELARHYEEAGELNSAFQHWLNTGLYAGRIFSKEEAFAAYQRAEQILYRLGQQASDLSIYQIYRQWGRLAYDLSDPQAVESIYQQLLEAGQARQNPLLAGSAYSGLAQAAELRMQPKLGMEHIEKAMPFLKQSGRLFEYIEALNRQGLFQMQTGQFQEAQVTLEKALRMGEQASDVQGLEARALTRYWLATLLTLNGWPVLAQEMIQLSIRDAVESLNQVMVVRSTGLHCLILQYLGRYSSSLECGLSALSAAKATHNLNFIAELHSTVAQACFYLGYMDKCLDHGHQAMQIVQQINNPILMGGLFYLMGRLYLFFGADDQAAQFFRHGGPGDNQDPVSLLNQMEYLLVAAEPHAAVPERLEAVLSFTQQQNLTSLYLQALLCKASLLLRSGQESEAADIVDTVRAEAQQRCLTELHTRAGLLQAEIDLRQGAYAQAVDHAREVVESAQAMTCLPYEIEGWRMRLKAARQGKLENPDVPLDVLQNKIQQIQQYCCLSSTDQLLQKARIAWTDF
jgi:predicted ATPase